MNHTKIGTSEAVAIILSVIASHAILSLPKTIVSATKSATILNLVYIIILMFAIAYLIYRLMKKFPGMDLLDISKYLAGSLFQKILGGFFILYFVVTSSFLLRNFCECLKTIYFPHTAILFLIFFFVMVVGIAQHLGFRATLKTTVLIMPIAFFMILFLFFSNIQNFTLQRAFPILGNGIYNTFVLGLTNLYSFGGIVFVYFLPPLLKQPEKLKKITFQSVALTAVYLLIIAMIVLFMFFFFLSKDEISPLYTAARYIEFGTFFQRLESVFLLVWIIVFCCYLSIVTKFSVSIFQKITNIQDSKIAVWPIVLCLFSITYLPKNFAVSHFFESKIYPYLVLGFGFGINILILLFANLKKKRKESR